MKKKKRNLTRIGSVLFALLLSAGTLLQLASCTVIDDNGTVTGTGTGSGNATTDNGEITPTPTPAGEGSVIFRDRTGAVLNVVSGAAGDSVTAYTRTGYRTVGYFSDAALTKPISAPTAIAEGETSVYVSWSDPIRYTVEFDAGLGLGVMEKVDATYDSRLSLPVCTFTKKDETFSEWRLYNADGGYQSFIDGAPVRNLTAEEGATVRLVAVYDTADAVNFTVTDGVVTAYNGNATHVVFPQQAHTVSADVFKNCAAAGQITKITVPADYKTIEFGAFAPCKKLASLTVPFIGGSADGDNFLAYVFGAETYLDNTYSFSATYNAYYGLLQSDIDLSGQKVPSTLKSVTVTGELYTISEGAFYMVYGLEKLSIPHCENLYAIGNRAFEGCWQLGYDATYGVQNPLWWMENVETIGDRAFAAYLSETNEEGSSYMFTRLFQMPALKKIRSIGKEAFYADVYLMGLEFGPELERIGAYAFINCASLPSLILPDSLTTIGEYAFTSCRSLETLYIGKGIRSIGAFAFADCTLLGTVTVAADAPAKVTNIPFSNGVDNKYNVLGQLEGYKPTFTVLSFVVPDTSLASYLIEWVSYADLIRSNAKQERKAFYYGKLDDGNFEASFEFDGKTLKVTDPLGVIGELFDPFDTVTIDSTFTLYWEEMARDETGAVGEEVFYRLWSPEILDPYRGEPYEVELRVRPEAVNVGEDRYRIPVAEQTSYYGTTVGEDESDSLWQIREDAYNHAMLYHRDSPDGEWTEVAAPEGTVYTECYLYAQLLFSREYMAVVYEDANGTPIDHKYFFSRDDELIPAGYQTFGTAMVFYSGTGIQFIVDGAGMAKINLFDGLNDTKQYVGSYELVSGAWGEESMKFRFTGLEGKDGVLTGEVTFDGFFGGRYHRGDYRLFLNGASYRTDTIYTSVDLEERDCVDRITKDTFTFYDYVDGNGNVLFRYASYASDGVTYHGTYTVDGDKIKIEIKKISNPFEGTIIDKRLSVRITNSVGSTDYVRRDDEGYTFWYSEDFYGTTLDYYMIRMDGYGNATIHDTHDDDVDVWYKGTYYNTGHSLGSDDYGEYWVYCFEGEECNQNGVLTGSGKTATFYYVVSTTLDDADEGTILSISQSDGETVIEVTDEKGQPFAELNVDPFGITTMTLMKLTYRDGEAVWEKDEEMSAKFRCVAYLNSKGTVAYVVVYDLAGNFMFVLAPDETGEWVYINDGTLNPQPAPDGFVTPDYGDDDKIG